MTYRRKFTASAAAHVVEQINRVRGSFGPLLESDIPDALDAIIEEISDKYGDSEPLPISGGDIELGMLPDGKMLSLWFSNEDFLTE